MSSANRPRLFAELPAGLAAVSLRLHGGAHCRPPISRMGNKAGYAGAILGALNLRSGQGADAYLWAEADPDVAALLCCYPDAAMLLRIAEIIRSWADEEPRALWNRLRAARKARGVEPGPNPADIMAGWVLTGAWSMRRGEPGSGYTESRTDTGIGAGHGDGAVAVAGRCHALANYATIASSNRLINVAGPDLMNTGKGGTTFGGAEFATPAGDVAEGFERVAEAMAGRAFLHQGSFQYRGPDAGIGRPEGMDAHDTHGAVRPVVAILSDSFPCLASRWPPVAVLPRIPAAEDVAKWLGTPGDLEGCVCYMDPPYLGTTGYAANLTRAEVVSVAVEYAAMGATVAVSEAVALPELLALGWHATEITAGRVGQKRTFSKQKQEFLTMNRGPAHSVATQVSMFTAGP